MNDTQKPRIAILLGDPAGIGPELTVKLLAEEKIRAMARIIVLADPRVWQLGEQASGLSVPCRTLAPGEEIDFSDERPLLLSEPRLETKEPVVGRVSEEAGRYSLACLRRGLDLCLQGDADAMCFAPLNKEAMHLGGLASEDESGLFIDHLGHTGPSGILNTLGNLWTSRASSHVSLRRACDIVKRDTVLAAIRLLDGALRASGIPSPRIAVAGLNPHAGDGGMFGDEEKKEIEPAVTAAKQEGIDASGPFPPDTIFLMGRDGRYDAIVTMYHDQGQIAMKLMGFDHGVTVHAGLPYPITTSAHGSAFDIAGRGEASVNALKQAFLLACSMTGKG